MDNEKTRPLKVGDVVRLGGFGPLMVVTWVHSEGIEACVRYFDDMGRLSSGDILPSDVLQRHIPPTTWALEEGEE